LRIRSVEEPLIRDRCRAVMEELGIEGISAKTPIAFLLDGHI
jgi:hypothetical protein